MKIHSVEQNTQEWEALRAGNPTASRFSELVTSTGSPSKSMQAYAIELAGEMYAGRPLDTWSGNKYTDYGHEIEDEARLAYEMRTGDTVEQVGFITDDLELYGCSPDGLVGDDGMVEIKCLPKKHIPSMLYWKKHGKVPPERIAQTQGQVMIAERKWCDLLFYRPGLPMLIVRQYPDLNFVDSLKSQLFSVMAERNLILKQLQEF